MTQAVMSKSGEVVEHSGDYLRLSSEESKRVLRIERLFALAVQMLRDPERARVWLKTPKVALGGQTPLAYQWVSLNPWPSIDGCLRARSMTEREPS